MNFKGFSVGRWKSRNLAVNKIINRLRAIYKFECKISNNLSGCDWVEYNSLKLTDETPSFTFLWLILEISMHSLDSYTELPLEYWKTKTIFLLVFKSKPLTKVILIGTKVVCNLRERLNNPGSELHFVKWIHWVIKTKPVQLGSANYGP